jgi:uncharacterized protein (DUF1800 family)
MIEFDPKVAHLLRRATLGPTMDEIVVASDRGLQPTLDDMLQQLDRPLTQKEAATAAIGDVFLQNEGRGLRAGWMLRMLSVPNLFREKLTLFWHNHFATAISKVNDPRMMANQVDTLRELALGKFRDLVTAMAKDPAMLIWLDNNLNVKGAPNENWARELMELFTCGIGNYTEKDVQEVARCFTGWNLDGRRYRFVADKHDETDKTIFGETGNFNGTDVINKLVVRKETARFISLKLWQFFVGQEPTDQDLEPLIAAYQSSDGEIRQVVKAMFLSPGFFDARNVGNQVKNPIEFVVGTARSLKAPQESVQDYADAAAGMGMDIYNPPDVSGWAGGEAWISSFTLLERIRLVRRLVNQGRGTHVCGLDTGKIIADGFISENDELIEHFSVTFLHRRPSKELKKTLSDFLTAGTRSSVIKLPAGEREAKIRGMIRLILCSPAYQLC